MISRVQVQILTVHRRPLLQSPNRAAARRPVAYTPTKASLSVDGTVPGAEQSRSVLSRYISITVHSKLMKPTFLTPIFNTFAINPDLLYTSFASINFSPLPERVEIANKNQENVLHVQI